MSQFNNDFAPYIKHLLYDVLLQTKYWFFYFGVMAFAYFQPIIPFFLAASGLIVLDLLTALFVVWYNSDGFCDFFRVKFESDKLKRTVFKLIFYGILLIIAHIISHPIFGGEQLMTPAIGLIAAVEVKSVLENIDSVLGTKFSELLAIFTKKKNN